VSTDNTQSADPRVAIIVLTWNGKALTLDCLDSLRELDYQNVEIVTVDNASTDGTAEAVRERYGETVTLIVNSENTGFSKGNNVGIKYALDKGADLVLLLNNDTTVSPALVDSLVSVFRNAPNVGIAGPKIFFSRPPDRIWFAGGEVFLARGTARHIGLRETDRGQYDNVRDVDYITGCALMARREVFGRIGMLDPAYQAYFEDTDFCMRARRAGYRIVYTPAGKVWHRISASTGGQLGRRKIMRKLRSTFRFFARYASPRHWLTLPFFFLADVIRVLFMVVFGRIRDTTEAPNAGTTGTGGHP